MGEDLRTKLEELIKPVVTAMGYEFWGLELSGQKGQGLLRVYVDSEHGVSIDDLSKISYQLNGLIDVEGVMPNKYIFEVSSPGLERSLFTLEQYRRFIGHMVRIKISGKEAFTRHNYLGKIDSVTDNDVTIISEGEKITFPFEKIVKAQLIKN